MILQLKDIRISFTNARSEVFNLLNGVNLEVPRGKITALVGGNGTGKTTLFNIISGFQQDFDGQVILDGKRLNGIAPHRISLMGIGRLFQGRQLMPDLTLMENMKIASDDKTGEFPFDSIFRRRKIAQSEKNKEEKAISILKRLFGDDNKYLGMLDRKASGFSYGEQRLIALACLLMGNDSFLLLDEPTAGVNPVYIDKIREIIRRMVDEDGLTVLLIEHNMHFVRDLADYCAYLDEGRIVKVGDVNEVLDDKEVRNSYLGV
ncbi:MAG: ABC transporter ATP-binding protein [Bacteroidales bacterium]|nr:ABC transporter ATP-binding protein [Bacteroidales bacterium]